MGKMVIPALCLSCHFMHVSSANASFGTVKLAVFGVLKIVFFV